LPLFNLFSDNAFFLIPPEEHQRQTERLHSVSEFIAFQVKSFPAEMPAGKPVIAGKTELRIYLSPAA
jgi:hypothetical protein